MLVAREHDHSYCMVVGWLGIASLCVFDGAGTLVEKHPTAQRWMQAMGARAKVTLSSWETRRQALTESEPGAEAVLELANLLTLDRPQLQAGDLADPRRLFQWAEQQRLADWRLQAEPVFDITTVMLDGRPDLAEDPAWQTLPTEKWADMTGDGPLQWLYWDTSIQDRLSVLMIDPGEHDPIVARYESAIEFVVRFVLRQMIEEIYNHIHDAGKQPV